MSRRSGGAAVRMGWIGVGSQAEGWELGGTFGFRGGTADGRAPNPCPRQRSKSAA